MNQVLDQTVALTMGGASGTGLITAKLFAQQGSSVVLIDYNQKMLSLAKRKLGNLDKTTSLAILCDFYDKRSMEQAIKQVIESFGHLNIAFIQ